MLNFFKQTSFALSLSCGWNSINFWRKYQFEFYDLSAQAELISSSRQLESMKTQWSLSQHVGRCTFITSALPKLWHYKPWHKSLRQQFKLILKNNFWSSSIGIWMYIFLIQCNFGHSSAFCSNSLELFTFNVASPTFSSHILFFETGARDILRLYIDYFKNKRAVINHDYLKSALSYGRMMITLLFLCPRMNTLCFI